MTIEKYLNTTREQFKAFAQLPIDTPLQMLNLLKFKATVTETGRSGKEQYKTYMKAASPFFQQSKGKIIFYGNPKFTLIGPAELEWDKVLIVEYATKADFINMITNPDYPSELRSLALTDSRLIFCEPSHS